MIVPVQLMALLIASRSQCAALLVLLAFNLVSTNTHMDTLLSAISFVIPSIFE
jgi:hypothetical protein